MFYVPYYYNPYMMRQLPTSFIRVLHASPDAPGVDVYANGDIIAKNLRYRGFTPYLKVPSGTYRIVVYPAGTTVRPVIDTTIAFAPGSIYTAAAIGRLSNIELFPILDPRIPVNPANANIRFVHLSPNAPAVDIVLPDGKVLFSNVAYKGITDYIPVPPGRYTLEARLAGSNNTVLTVPNITLQRGNNITAYAVGLASGEPGLQLLLPLDGSTYL